MAATTTPKAVILRMPNAIVMVHLPYLARLCPTKKKGKQPQPVNEKKSDNSEPTNLLEGAMKSPGEEQGVGVYSLFNFGSQRPLPYKVQLSVAGQPLEMEVDTGASLSVISEELYNSLVSAGQAP